MVVSLFVRGQQSVNEKSMPFMLQRIANERSSCSTLLFNLAFLVKKGGIFYASYGSYNLITRQSGAPRKL